MTRITAILALACRIAVFSANSALASFFDRSDIGSVMYYSAVQVCIVSMGFACYRVASYVIAAVRRDRYMTLERVGEHTEDAEAGQVPVETKIEFSDASQLRQHVFAVHKLGLLLWCVVMALDFEHPWACLAFTAGLTLSSMATDLSALNKSTGNTGMRLLGLLAYVIVACLLLFVGVWVHWPLESMQQMPVAAMWGMATMILAGMVWGRSQDVLVGAQGDFAELAYSAGSTCLIIAVPVFYVLHRERGLSNSALVLASSAMEDGGRLAFLAIVVEPALKLLAVCVVVLAVRSGRTRELVFPLAGVLAARTLGERRQDVPEPTANAAAACIVVAVIAAGVRAVA